MLLTDSLLFIPLTYSKLQVFKKWGEKIRTFMVIKHITNIDQSVAYCL